MKRCVIALLLPFVGTCSVIHNWVDIGYRINGEYIIDFPTYQHDMGRTPPPDENKPPRYDPTAAWCGVENPAPTSPTPEPSTFPLAVVGGLIFCLRKTKR